MQNNNNKIETFDCTYMVYGVYGIIEDRFVIYYS